MNYNVSFEEGLGIYKKFKEEYYQKELEALNNNDMERYETILGLESDMYHWLYSNKVLDILNKDVLMDDEGFIYTGTRPIMNSKDKLKTVVDDFLNKKFSYIKDRKDAIGGIEYNFDEKYKGIISIIEDEDVIIKLVAVKSNKTNVNTALIYVITKFKDDETIEDFKVMPYKIPLSLLINKKFWFIKDEGNYCGVNMVIK